MPRFAVISGSGLVDQSTWVLRQLGFDADPFSIAAIDTAATSPLTGYDLMFNTSGVPTQDGNGNTINTVARARIAAFIAAGGGYISGQSAGANLLTGLGTVSGLTATSNSGGGDGYSGIALWDNVGGAGSVITGAYPAQDTLIMDPPTWLTSVPPTWTRRRSVRDRRVLPLRPVPGQRDVGRGRLHRDRARHEHRQHGAAGRVRQQPAVPRRPGARVADGRQRRVLGRQLDASLGRPAAHFGGGPAE